MAFAVKFTDDSRVWANLDQSVPVRYSGKWDDVMVVQALLRELFKLNKGKFHPPVAVPEANGRFDGNTATLIRFYQGTVHKRKKPDGIVSPVYETSFYRSWHHTIIELQIDLYMVLLALSIGEPVVDYLSQVYPHLDTPLSKKLDHSIPPSEEFPYSGQ